MFVTARLPVTGAVFSRLHRMGPIAMSVSFEGYSPSFADVLGDAPRLEKVADVDAHEGPVYVASEDALYFTTLPQPGPEVAIKRLSLATGEVRLVRQATNAANGMALDLAGRLLVCEQGRAHTRERISRID